MLGPELLAMLRAMGHGDEIVIVDSNFPAAANAQRLVRMDGVTAPSLVRAIAAILPLDDFVPCAAFRMAVTGAPDSVPGVCREFVSILAAAGYKGAIEAIERMEFYERTKLAYGVVATGEPRPWGNLILKKGTIMPAGG